MINVVGFSFVKDAETYDYPVVEAIKSVLPLCNYFVVAVGKSRDNTLALIKNIDPKKIIIIETIWNESKREGGYVLAEETDKAYKAIVANCDWAIYIQGDEVIHEKYLPVMYDNMLKYKDDISVDGFLFHYKHFYGSYDYIAFGSKFYKNEIRIVRKNDTIYSYRDAQGFRKNNNQKLSVIPIDATVCHYGWVKKPTAMQAKQENFHKYWHDDKWIDSHVIKASEYDYNNINYLKPFNDSHPEVMKERIKNINWKFEYDISKNKMSFKDFFKKILYFLFNIDLNYKNYKIIKKRQ